MSLVQCGTCGCTHNRDRIATLQDENRDLERQLESARRIAVALEQELANTTRPTGRELVRALHSPAGWTCPGTDCPAAPHRAMTRCCEHCLDLSGMHSDAIYPCATIRALESDQ
jgi:hypothetical protein